MENAKTLKILEERLKAKDFGFLAPLGLGARQSAVVKEALQFSVSQGSFPKLHGFSRHLGELSINTANLFHLKRRGFITNVNPGRDVWVFAAKLFEHLDHAARAVNGKGRRRRTPRMEPFWAYLMRVRDGEEILFTSEHAKAAARELDMHRTDSYKMLRRFERRGLLKRKHARRGKGIFVTFLGGGASPASEPATPARESGAAKNGSKMTVGEFASLLEVEIEKISGAIAGQEASLAEMKALRDRKAATLAELKSSIR